jgi:hypothetical protein
LKKLEAPSGKKVTKKKVRERVAKSSKLKAERTSDFYLRPSD